MRIYKKKMVFSLFVLNIKNKFKNIEHNKKKKMICFVAGIWWSGMSGGDGKGKHDGRKIKHCIYTIIREL